MTKENVPAIQFDWAQLFEALNIGLILVDEQGCVLLWNEWITKHSGIHSDTVINKALINAFPEPLAGSFIAAINRALSTKLPVVLSNALHKFPLPLFNLNGSGERISQSIILSPLKNLHDQGKLMCLIQVNDSSTSIKREQMLRDHSETHKKDATTDPLTGIYNRRFFDAHYKLEISQAQRQKTTLSLIMLDIDYFKNYNDHYGHPAGDAAIIAVANCIKNKLQRSSDMAARYGGEEFIVLLPNSTSTAAQLFAEIIRQAVFDLKIPHLSSLTAKHLSVSIGVSSCPPGMIVDADTFLKNTDLALYAAKQKGRNQVQYLPL
ncbi:sensor domain-containing diguanylate cyclase [Solimicrobium silvestre]|uniref:diguanylate cyclase n=1 Tax=Solimicrobium silvestre TaxID=2099400 RepID=A0A2S9GZB6_9BURK|nr:diguanylate cyclase [Solimicrobium silvestre]PRC93047.1 GGDEF: diguanylate cyclase (GGDEF) domain [Solimicrobium silvestre]